MKSYNSCKLTTQKFIKVVPNHPKLSTVDQYVITNKWFLSEQTRSCINWGMSQINH